MEEAVESEQVTFSEQRDDIKTVRCDIPLSLDNNKDNNKRLQTEMRLDKKGWWVSKRLMKSASNTITPSAHTYYLFLESQIG